MSSPAEIRSQLNNKSLRKEKLKDVIGKESNEKMKLVWWNIFLLSLLHIGALHGIYLMFTSAKVATMAFALILERIGILSITAGVHRLWSHQSYKAKWPLRLLLAIIHTSVFQMSIIRWARNHRLHHKYSDTNADPHNSKRGFFFCQIGWILVLKNNEAKEKLKGIDVSDLFDDPILRFQHKYYFPLLGPFVSFVLPPMIAVYCWNESWSNAFFITGALRWVVSTHITSLVNSFAHMFGNKPYDRNINPGENKAVSILTLGEGWHNYHHTFPWDYKTSEFGNYSVNATNAFIDFCAYIGLAYDLKTVSADMIKKRVHRTGDGTHEVWGWGDKDITKEDQEATIITHKQR